MHETGAIAARSFFVFLNLDDFQKWVFSIRFARNDLGF